MTTRSAAIVVVEVQFAEPARDRHGLVQDRWPLR
jgi:hypothetical protein